MKRIYAGMAVALLTFCLGIAISTILSTSHREAACSSSILSWSPDEDWHRLYEAAGLSGDGAIIKEVNDRLLCANSAGVPDALFVEIEASVGCKKVDGSIYELRVNDTSEYGSFYRRITASHSSWTLRNLDFVRRISTAKRAREYVFTHEWPPSR